MAQVPAGAPAQDEPVQLSLLAGFAASTTASAAAGPALAAELPVGRVLIESSLPHLDRPFDYSVPADLASSARPGVRVKVKFNGQELPGYLLDIELLEVSWHMAAALSRGPVPLLSRYDARPRLPGG